MAMERHVFFRGKLPSKAALAKAMRDLGFRFTLKPATGSLEQQSGYMPMLLKGEETGVEFDVFEGRTTIDEFEAGDVHASFDRSANFRWGGNETKMLAALCASTALAKLTGGIVFDEEEGELQPPAEAIEAAAKIYASLTKPETTQHPGTRPADIKRYLKPLLKQRSDLILMGRALLIRPIRHVIRGAFLDRTSGKYQFRIWRYITPLYDAWSGGLGYGSAFHPAEVWQPHFLPELLDRLDQDVFEPLGRAASLADFASASAEILDPHWRPHFEDARIVALVLAGESERAVEDVNEIERKNPGHHHYTYWVKGQRAFLARDIDELCKEYHAKEAKAAEALKLGDIWEPSPFPVELPAAERATRTNETTFVTKPWVTKPDWLLQDAPEKPGDVRFAKDHIVRKGRVVLLVTLTRDEAQEMHRTNQDYVLAARLTDASLLLLDRRTGWSPHHPVQGKWPNYGPNVHLHLWLISSSHSLRLSAREDWERRDTLNVDSISVRNNEQEVWLGYFTLREGTRMVYDSRPADRIRTETELTGEERNLISFPVPQFGEFAELLERVRMLLRISGYGEFT
jgi:hypothetical protein